MENVALEFLQYKTGITEKREEKMILYFSATGNTRYAVQQIAKATSIRMRI